jgi:hypothetical protein
MASAHSDPADTLSVPEMLRIMDVATAIRQDRELVHEQLNLDELKARLRARMIAAAKVTGEEVTAEEVDAAVAQYYRNLHVFHDPPWSFAVALAHLWVLRQTLAWSVGLSLGTLAVAWFLFLSPRGPMTVTGRTHRQVETLASEVTRRRDAIRALARDPAASSDADRLAAEADVFVKQDDPTKLAALTASLSGLEARLRDEYAVNVVSGAGHKSAVDRYFTDRDGRRVSGYYLIVEAKRPDGTLVSRRVHNAETGRDEEVTTWAERVPKEVYDRLAHDKRSDGVLDETAFAIKRRGFTDEQITMPGADGRPLSRLGQITKW